MTTPTTVSVRLQLRADTAANWTSTNPILLANELGRETDTNKIKIGNGSTAWNSLAYQAWATLPIAVNVGGTGQTTYTNGQLLIGNTTGNTLTKATLTAGAGVAITNGTGTITVAASGIVDAQIAAGAEIAVSKLADGTPRQLLQTDAAGTGVEWASNIDVPGTLDVTSTATFDAAVTIQGDLTVNGTTTTIDTANLIVEDKNIIVGKVTTPTDITADGGGITLKGTTDKTINWIDSTDAWTLSEHVNIVSAKEYRIAGAKVLDATSLGSAVVSSSLTSVGTIGTGTWQGATVATGYGGTGQTTYSNGQLLIGKTDGTLAKATLTGGTGITVTNADGSISIASTVTGTVTAVTGTSPIASTGGTTPDISIQDGTTAQKGAVQLEDSTSSTSTTKAATPASVKTAYDLANAALPKAGGTITGNLEIGTAGSISFEGATANDFETTIAVVDPTADRTITLPDITGTIVTTGDTGTVTSTMILDGTIVDGDINASAAIVDTKLATISTTGKVSNSATTATDVNTASAIVARDGSGNFTAGTITAALTGAASSNVLKAGDTMTGVLAITAGTAALPGLAVSGDPNTGVFSPGADQVAISTGGVQRINIEADGDINIDGGGVFYDATNNRLAIGTTSPAAILHAVSADNATTGLISGATNAIRIVGNNTGVGGGAIEGVNAAASAFAPLLVGGSDLRLAISGTERARIDSSGRLLVGTSTSVWDGQVEAARVGGSQFVGHRYGANSFPVEMALLKSRGASIGTNTVLSDGDNIGVVAFRGADGTNYIQAASITAAVDGTPGANDMPGRLVFATTADGASSPTERMRISQAGFVGVNTASPVTRLDLSGNYGQNIVAVAALNIDCSAGNYFTKTINGASTFTVSSVPASRAYSFTLELTHTSGTVTWFSGVEWPGGTPPTLTTGKTHLFMFVTDDGGSRWRGASLTNYTN